MSGSVNSGARDRALGRARRPDPARPRRVDGARPVRSPAQTIATSWASASRRPSTSSAARLEHHVSRTPAGERLQALGRRFSPSGRAVLSRLPRGAGRSLLGEREATRTRELSSEHGYDTKLAMHALRTAVQRIELLSTGCSRMRTGRRGGRRSVGTWRIDTRGPLRVAVSIEHACHGESSSAAVRGDEMSIFHAPGREGAPRRSVRRRRPALLHPRRAAAPTAGNGGTCSALVHANSATAQAGPPQPAHPSSRRCSSACGRRSPVSPAPPATPPARAPAIASAVAGRRSENVQRLAP